MTDEQLAVRPSPELWPVWATVAHTAGARAYWLCEVIGEPGADMLPFTNLADGGWEDDLDHPRGAGELVEALDSTWRLLEGCLDRWTPEMLASGIRARVCRHGAGPHPRLDPPAPLQPRRVPLRRAVPDPRHPRAGADRPVAPMRSWHAGVAAGLVLLVSCTAVREPSPSASIAPSAEPSPSVAAASASATAEPSPSVPLARPVTEQVEEGIRLTVTLDRDRTGFVSGSSPRRWSRTSAAMSSSGATRAAASTPFPSGCGRTIRRVPPTDAKTGRAMSDPQAGDGGQAHDRFRSGIQLPPRRVARQRRKLRMHKRPSGE